MDSEEEAGIMSKFDKFVSRATGVVALITMIYGFMTFGNNKLKDTMKEVVKEELVCVKEDIKKVSYYIESQKINNIEKQYTKIITDIQDVKINDIEQAIHDFNFLPEENKTASLIFKYNKILEFYNKS